MACALGGASRPPLSQPAASAAALRLLGDSISSSAAGAGAAVAARQVTNSSSNGSSSTVLAALQLPAAPTTSAAGGRLPLGFYQLPLVRRSRGLATAAVSVAAAATAAAALPYGSHRQANSLAGKGAPATAKTSAAAKIGSSEAPSAYAAATVSSTRNSPFLWGVVLAVPTSFFFRIFFQQQQQQKQQQQRQQQQKQQHHHHVTSSVTIGPGVLPRLPLALHQSAALCEQPLKQHQQPQQQQQAELDEQLLQQLVGEPKSAWSLSLSSTQNALRQLGLAMAVVQVAANSPVEDRALCASLPAAAAAGGCGAAGAPVVGGPKTQEELEALAQQVFPDEIEGAAGPAPVVLPRVELPVDPKSNMQQQPRCLVAIVDGHGGPDVAEYVHRELPRFVAEELARGDAADFSHEEKALSRAFGRLDETIGASVDAAYTLGIKRSVKVGACCVALLFTEKRLIIANSGDCMAVLQRGFGSDSSSSKGEEVIPLNDQHNANSFEERRRLQQMHPKEEDVVICKRQWQEPRQPQNAFHSILHSVGLLGNHTLHSSCYVKGRLQPTRVFGDFMLKKDKYVEELQRGRRRRATAYSGSNTATIGAAAAASVSQDTWSFPYVVVEPQTQILLRKGDEAFVVVGTDGLWDFLSPEEAAAIVRSSLRNCSSSNPTDAAKGAANAVVREVLHRAAAEKGISVAAALTAPPKQRRRIFDDTTVAVVLMNAVTSQ